MFPLASFVGILYFSHDSLLVAGLRHRDPHLSRETRWEMLNNPILASTIEERAFAAVGADAEGVARISSEAVGVLSNNQCYFMGGK